MPHKKVAHTVDTIPGPFSGPGYEATYIANTKSDTSRTSDNSDKLCNTFIVLKFTYKATSVHDGEDLLRTQTALVKTWTGPGVSFFFLDALST